MIARRTLARVGAVLVAAFCAAWATARAHSIYPWECCSDRDCWPAGAFDDAKEPEPVADGEDWVLFDGARVKQRAARPSPDGRFHVCRRGGDRAGAVIVASDGRPCFWAPQANS